MTTATTDRGFTYRDFPETKNVHSSTCICDLEPIFNVETSTGFVARNIDLAQAERIMRGREDCFLS